MFKNEFLKAQKVKFNMESNAIRVKNFKAEGIFGLQGHSEAEIADFNFTSKNLDVFFIFRQQVSIAKETPKQPAKGPKNPKKITPPITPAGLLGPDLVLNCYTVLQNITSV